jgi:hypothetical protein
MMQGRRNAAASGLSSRSLESSSAGRVAGHGTQGLIRRAPQSSFTRCRIKPKKGRGMLVDFSALPVQDGEQPCPCCATSVTCFRLLRKHCRSESPLTRHHLQLLLPRSITHTVFLVSSIALLVSYIRFMTLSLLEKCDLSGRKGYEKTMNPLHLSAKIVLIGRK